MTLLVFTILSVSCLAVVVIWLVFSLRKLGRRGQLGETWDSFFLRDGELVINTLIQRSVFRIEDIEYVQFYCRHHHGYYGQYQIFKIRGKESRRFMFDASVYTRHMQLRSSREEIEKAIEKMRAELQAFGIRTEYFA